MNNKHESNVPSPGEAAARQDEQPTVGKRSLIETAFGVPTVQRRALSSGSPREGHGQTTESGVGKQTLVERTFGAPHTPHEIAKNAVGSGGGQLPYLDDIQRSFGRHDISGVSAHQGPAVSQAASALGARAFAVGNAVAFDGAPDLHTAAHEAAHTVQQRGAVQLKGGVGDAGDAHERHADQVADHVVAGTSAEHLLDTYTGGPSSASLGAASTSTVQRQVGPAVNEAQNLSSSFEDPSPEVSSSSDSTTPSEALSSPASAGPAPASTLSPGAKTSVAAGHTASVGSHAPGDSSRTEGGHGDSAVPVGHQAHKLKIEIGRGSITGAITLSVELGKTGVPVQDHLKLIKSTLSTKLNGFVTKLETVVLNGNLDAEILDGVKVAVDVSVLKMSSDKLKPDDNLAALELMTVALKLQGDVGHWMELAPGAKITLEGQVQIALGGKLAAQFARYTAAQLDRMMLAKETEVVGEAVAKHVHEVERIESQLTKLRANPSAARREIKMLEEELFRHRIQVSTGNQQLRRLDGLLKNAKGRVRAALTRIEGKFAKKIAWAMEKKVVATVAKHLARLLPILNVVSTVADVIEIVKLVRDVIKHHGQVELGGGGDGDDAAAHDAEPAGATGGAVPQGDPANAGGVGDAGTSSTGSENATPQAAGAGASNVDAGDPAQGAGATGAAKTDPRSVDAAKRALSPGAQAVIDAVMHKGGPGPVLDADQIRMAGLLVPPDLGPDQIREVISMLRSASSSARTPDEAIIAIDQAVRAVRNRNRAMTVSMDGVASTELVPSADIDGEGARLTSNGPITSPGQVDDPAKQDDAFIVVHQAPPGVIGRWFSTDGRDLVLNDEGARWRAAHRFQKIGGKQLLDVVPVISRTGEGHWDLELSFRLRSAAQEPARVDHSFMVERGQASSLGAQVGELAFEPRTFVRSS